MEPKDVMTTGRFAEIMKVTSVTVINWTKKAGLPCHRIARGPRKIRVSDAVAFLTENDFPIPEELTPEPKRKAAVRFR